ncbi:MAG: hypothetical protein U0269_11920 [Polyangiales bacterium]
MDFDPMSDGNSTQDAARDERASQTDAPTPTPTRKEKEVRALPVVAVCVLLLTAALALYAGRREPGAGARTAAPPQPVTDADHYVESSPAWVAERFLRAWMRQRYDVARDLSVGALRDRCELRQRELDALVPAQRAEIDQTRAFTAATHYDLEHVETQDLAPDAQGRARKEVRGQGHVRGAYAGVRVDSRRGQTFILVQIDGRWRVAERTWERGAGERDVDGGSAQ